MTIVEDRLSILEQLNLKSGKHTANNDLAMCALEAVAYIAGEDWSDHPICVDPVIAAFGRAWNDGLRSDEDRDRWLKPFLPRMVGTRSTPEIQDQRAFMASDWAVRVYTPAWLRLAKLDSHADALLALPELSSVKLCESAMPIIGEARDAAWDAAGDAAGAAAWDAAGAAAGDAAWAAAWAAAWDAAGGAAWDAAWAAAGDAAGAAAGAAARAAAGDAAWDAARAALTPTVAILQPLAADLLDRMIKLTESS